MKQPFPERPVDLGRWTGSDADPSTDFSWFFMIFHDFSCIYMFQSWFVKFGKVFRDPVPSCHPWALAFQSSYGTIHCVMLLFWLPSGSSDSFFWIRYTWRSFQRLGITMPWWHGEGSFGTEVGRVVVVAVAGTGGSAEDIKCCCGIVLAHSKLLTALLSKAKAMPPKAVRKSSDEALRDRLGASSLFSHWNTESTQTDVNKASQGLRALQSHSFGDRLLHHW